MVQDELQRYIFKIHSAKLRSAKWDLKLKIGDARKNEEVVSLAGSQILRWIDELNGDTDCHERAMMIRHKIKRLKNSPTSPETKREIRRLYAELDKLQFYPDYVTIVMDRVSDYRRLCKGFKINGIKYKRLLGTSGGIKMSTIVFVSERLYPELARRIDNGRDMTKKFNPAKLEAYKALTCSASHPVSMPKGIAVVRDCETEFIDTVIHLSNAEGDGEPIMSEPTRELVKIDASDGFGLMLPCIAERWSEELGLDYVMAGANSRCSWEKGMLFTFDFLDFAEKVGGGYIIKDAWGDDVDLRDVEVVLTESMLKLWDSYPSCAEYMRNCEENHYSFALTKTTPKELESERCLNYQFIQSFHLDDDDINELVSTSLNEIADVLGRDWRKTLLFLKGSGMNEHNVQNMEDDYMKAIMICPEIVNDSYVNDCVYRQIKKRITRAKTGVIKVHGNFSIASGDPYALCQHMFGQTVTGLLKAGEVYNKYWSDRNTDKVVIFRAPMSTHENLRKMHPANNDDVNYWYRYMNACTIFNAWGTEMAALNGMDFDGDLVMLTDNPVLVRRHRDLPALVCAQSSAQKIIPTEDDLINSNIAGFGNAIGSITNRITAMYEVQSQYGEDTEEYKILDYRIGAGQLAQQDAIDKIKGIVSKPMPREWYDPFYVRRIEDENKRELYERIIADRKPYFMRYVYPQLSHEYAEFERNMKLNGKIKYGSDITDNPDFANEFTKESPLGLNDCVMNKICRIFESNFDGKYSHLHSPDGEFDYQLMKSGVPYDNDDYVEIRKLYNQYNLRITNYKKNAHYERTDEYDTSSQMSALREEFMEECYKVCPNRYELCDIILDLTYKSTSSKGFPWAVCGDVIIENLFAKSNNDMTFPELDPDGDIHFCGNTYSLRTINTKEVAVIETICE